jgi:hypothetical protein
MGNMLISVDGIEVATAQGQSVLQACDADGQKRTRERFLQLLERPSGFGVSMDPASSAKSRTQFENSLKADADIRPQWIQRKLAVRP